ncbi:T9SS type A sorting domain-containing protein [Aureispira anguillae]|uniref:T9SS type A sorting domain-containing protein n=1 Tax=Aureispira anguillae TaxID=2864201 RepID=A0A915YB22_9BACT|nr:T9SS type A sorting domain-containing protein [Aureispira anguillae]BDS09797.1 T9SS type A sorting domain-containing protein [Aureispira anguillae]
MIKGQFIITTTLLLIFGYKSMQAQHCTESMAQEYIENTDMKIMFRNGGDMFWDGNSSAQYSVPHVYGQPQTNTIFAGGVWMGAYDDGGNLRLAAQTYRSSGNDYWAGPLDPTTGLPITNSCTNFDQIWKVKRWAIEQHIADINDNGVVDGPTDLSLLKWPGRGNPHFAAQMGFNLPDQDLAPFYDANGDGVYTPLHGDYPVFEHGNPNAIAEEILWSVFNDNGNLHTQTNGMNLMVEVQQTAYVFNCGNDPLLDKTLFVKHKVINKNALVLRDYYYGIWTDFDLGCSVDDYVGTIPAKNTIYAYNADNNDDNPCGVAGTTGYGSNPPVQAVTILNHSLEHSIYHTNSNSSPTGDPQATLSYYYLLEGKFPNGTPLTTGGDGYDPANPNAVVTNHIFPDNPNDPSGWSMATAGLAGLDQRVLGSIYKDSLMPGESFMVDLAYSYHHDPDSNHLQNVNLLYQQVDLVQQYYDNNFVLTGCATPTYCTANCVYPGDANNNGIANDFDILEMGLNYNNTASTRTIVGDRWMPHTPPTPATNAYVDANGDATVDLLDMATNTTNFNSTHALYTGAAEGANTIGTDLFFERYYPTTPILPGTDTIVDLNRYAILDVYFGEALQQINNVLGVTYRIDYDETVFDLQTTGTFGTLGTILNNGWLDDDGAAVYSRALYETGKVHYVATRLDQTNYTGGGTMGRLLLRVKPTAPISANVMSTQICFEDFKAIRADGSTISIGGQCGTILYRDTNFVSNSVQRVTAYTPAVEIYPNPSTHYINVDLGGEQAKNIQLFNVLGELVEQVENVSGVTQFAKNNLAKGMYTIAIQFENGMRSSHKVIFN